MNGVTYDTGALIAAERQDRGLWLLHFRALAHGQVPVVPAAVLAQAWRGGPQPLLSRLLHGCVVEDLTRDRARSAGEACARSRTRDIVDASVVLGALERGDLVVTSDAEELGHIARAVGGRARIHRI